MLGLLLSLEETVVTVKRGGTSLMVILLSLLSLLLFSLSQNHQYCCNCYHHRYAYFNSFSSFLMNGETSLIFFIVTLHISLNGITTIGLLSHHTCEHLSADALRFVSTGQEQLVYEGQLSPFTDLGVFGIMKNSKNLESMDP